MTDIPNLEGWMTVAQAAEVFGVTRQSLVRMIREGKFASARKVGDKPIFLLETDEVYEVARAKGR